MKKYQGIKRKFYSLLAAVVTVIIGSSMLNSCYYDNEEYLYPTTGQSNCDTLSPTYSASIAPIFENNCNGCHSSSSPSGGIITDNHTSLTSNINKVWLSINHLDGALPMPQNANKLIDCDIAKIRNWRNLGMPNN